MTCFRVSLFTCTTVALITVCKSPLTQWVTTIHDSVRDDQYLVGLELQNYPRQQEDANDQDQDSSEGRVRATASVSRRQAEPPAVPVAAL